MTAVSPHSETPNEGAVGIALDPCGMRVDRLPGDADHSAEGFVRPQPLQFALALLRDADAGLESQAPVRLAPIVDADIRVEVTADPGEDRLGEPRSRLGHLEGQARHPEQQRAALL